MKTITKTDIIVFPKYMRSIQTATATAYPKFAAGDGAAAFAAGIFEKYVGIISDDMVYPALIFLNNLINTSGDRAVRERSVLLAVRLFFMRLRLREEKGFFGGLTINAEKEVSKSYELVLSQIKLRSPDVYYFLSKIGDNVVSELGDTVNEAENNINIILNRLEKKSVYSNTAAQNVLSVFRTAAVRAYKFVYGTHNTEEISVSNTASAERDTHTYDLNSTRILKENTVADNSDVLINASDRETNKDENGSDKIYKIYFTGTAKPDLSQAQPQVNIDDFVDEKNIKWMSAETAKGNAENPEYVTAETVLHSETQSKTVEKLSEKHSETISAVNGKSISSKTSLQCFTKSFLCLSGFNKIGIISNERQILFKSNERENNLLAASFTRHSVTSEQPDDHSFESVVTERNDTGRIFKSSVFSERLIEREKTLGGVEKFVRFIREKSRIFSREERLEQQIERFGERSNTSGNSYLENTITQRFGMKRIFNSSIFSEWLIEREKTLGGVEKFVRDIREKSSIFSREERLEQQIERFSERSNTSGNSYLENTITQRLGTERIFNSSIFSEWLIERKKMLGGVEKIVRDIREKSIFFTREAWFGENLTDKQTRRAERSPERIFNKSATLSRRFVERIKTLRNIEKFTQSTQFVRGNNSVFLEERLEAQFVDSQIKGQSRSTERFLTKRRDIERIFNNSNDLSERFVERVKTLGGIEKFARSIREKINVFSRKERLETLPELSEHHNNVFLGAVFAETQYLRTSEHINTFFRSDRPEFTGSRKNSIVDYKIKTLAKHDIAGEYPSNAANSAPDVEKSTIQYGRTVNLNYKVEKAERTQTEHRQSGVSKNDLIEQYGNLIDYDVSQSSKAAPAFTLTDAALIRSNSEMAAINKANIEQLKEKQIELEQNVLSRSDADRLYDDFMRKLRQQMRLEKSRFTG